MIPAEASHAYFFSRELGVLNLGQLWEKHRDELMAAWLEEHPGTRPAGWWRHDAEALRRVLPGQGIEGEVGQIFPVRVGVCELGAHAS